MLKSVFSAGNRWGHSFPRCMLPNAKSRSLSSLASIQIEAELDEDTKQLQQVALDFACKELTPNSSAWDETHTFPTNVLKKAASLGFGGKHHSLPPLKSPIAHSRQASTSQSSTEALVWTGSPPA
eukprot:Sdes_comp20066_c0_seq1m12961